MVIDILGYAIVIFTIIVLGIMLFSPQKQNNNRPSNKNSKHPIKTSKKANTIKVTITESTNDNVNVSKSFIVENNDLNLNVDKKVKEEVINSLVEKWSKEEKKYEKRERKSYNNWLAYRLITTYKELLDTANFYDFEKNAQEFSRIKNEALKKRVTMSNIMVVARYCKLQYYIEECDYEITHSDTEKLKKWKEFSDKDLSVDKIIDNYKEYWDEVIANYKRPSARTNRLKYLVEKLTEIREKPYIQESQLFIDKIDALKAHYSNQLISQNTSK